MPIRDWRETLPVEVDALRGSPDVQDMTGAERAGFLWLVMAQWRSEDGYLPADEDVLRKASGLRDEWAAAKQAVLALFQVVGRGVCYLPIRAAWERKLKAHKAMSDGGRRGAESRMERPQVDGWLEGGRRVADGTPAQPESSLSNTNMLYGGKKEKSKSSVIRASEGESEQPQKKERELAKSANAESGSDESEGKKKARVLSEDLGEKRALSALNSEALPRQELKDSRAGDSRSNAERVVDAYASVEEKWMPDDWSPIFGGALGARDLTEVFPSTATGYQVFASGINEGAPLIAITEEIPIAEAKARFGDAGIPCDVQQEHYEAPIASESDVLDAVVDADDADEFIQAQQAQAEMPAPIRPKRRVAPAPARRGLR